MGYGIDPKVDIVFQKVYGSEPNQSLLTNACNAIFADVLEYPIVSLQILNPYILPTTTDKKRSIFDIKARDPDGRLFGLEMQMIARRVYRKRSLFYWCQKYVSQLARGEDSYQKLKQVYSAHFVNTNLFGQKSEFHESFFIRNNRKPYQRLTTDFSLHFLQLPLFNKTASQLVSPLDRWPTFSNMAKTSIQKRYR